MAAIERAPVDIVLVDSTGIALAFDLVRNDPFLRNRPKVLDLGLVNERQLAALCARYTVAVFDRQQASTLGLDPGAALDPAENDGRARRRSLIARLGCGIPVTTN